MAATIRFATPDDAPAILTIYAPYCESTSISFEVVAPTEREMKERIARIAADYPWLVCAIDGQVAGYAYASRHRERAAYRWGVDVAVYVDKAHHRRNMGRALYTSLLGILRILQFVRAYAGVTLPNAASVGLHEAMGFTPVAVFRNEGFKLGKWRDVGWWELELCDDLPDRPEEPRVIGDICDSLAVAELLRAGERLLATG